MSGKEEISTRDWSQPSPLSKTSTAVAAHKAFDLNMEELQDAIEDAQYVNAIATQEDGPRPVLRWEVPTEEQLLIWQDSIRKKKQDGVLWDVDSTLSSAIGFFLFSSYVKEVENDYCRINFCEDVIRFRKLRGLDRLEKIQTMLRLYLTDPPSVDQENGELKLPPRTEIKAYEEERVAPDLRLTIEQFQSFYKISMDYPTCSESSVGLKGSAREDLFHKLRELEDTLANLRASTVVAESTGGSDKEIISNWAPSPAVSGIAEDTTERSATEESEVKEQASKPISRNESKSMYVKPTGVIEPEIKEQSSNDTTALQDAKKERKSMFIKPTGPMRGLTTRLRSDSARKLAGDVFDKAEAVVMESLRRNYWAKFLESPQFSKLKNFLWYQDRPVLPEDFFVMRVLGRGGFGLVTGTFLLKLFVCSSAPNDGIGLLLTLAISNLSSSRTACKKGTSGKLYAMKVMNKRRIKMKKSEQLALNERQALAAVESNFVVNLKYSFHSKDDVFLILDLMTGGDLGYHLHQKGRFPKKECQYYAARIMLGLQAMHDEGYVYRDLKPENCLLAEDGRVKITDLGLAIKITPTLHGAAGTRGYWAPEMLRRDKKGKRMPYGHAVDWFSFGCCVAEFISGSNPFRSESALNFGLERGTQTKEKAIDCATLEMDPKYPPEKFDSEAADVCRRLLDKNETTRLGANGSEEIMAHPWFKNLNWASIISDRKRPPFVPLKDVNAASQSEIGNFAEDKAYQDITESDDKVYKDWAWTNPRAFAAEVIEFLIYERETGEPLIPVAQHAPCCCVIL